MARPAAAGPAGVRRADEQSTPVRNQVRSLRTRRGLAQGELAEAMGVSRQTINSIENERYTPSLPLAIALARFFGVTVEEMFDDQGS
jgi:putative transcriptional regulator